MGDPDTLYKHDWSEYRGGRWLLHNGRKDQAVFTVKATAGYLWQHRKQIGYAPTVDIAKGLVEAAAEIYPRHIR
jgi:hypothetical protein